MADGRRARRDRRRRPRARPSRPQAPEVALGGFSPEALKCFSRFTRRHRCDRVVRQSVAEKSNNDPSWMLGWGRIESRGARSRSWLARTDRLPELLARNAKLRTQGVCEESVADLCACRKRAMGAKRLTRRDHLRPELVIRAASRFPSVSAAEPIDVLPGWDGRRRGHPSWVARRLRARSSSMSSSRSARWCSGSVRANRSRYG